MKVILFKSVENLGLPGEITEVKAGYFRNFLQPRGIAVEASPGNLKSLEQKRKKLAAEAAKIVKAAEALGEQLKGVTLTFTLKAGENDRLFGSVTTADVADQLAGMGFEIDRKRISLPSSIKTLGTYNAKVKLEGNVNVPIAVIVKRDGPPIKEEKTEEKTAEPESDAAAEEKTEASE
ncbi:50S ribosomal protein L9 [Candidatus Sumerlaeota bacterium]|nr:50S ribosomal protein L9 [Candidatus Sumerlaeota bacterium]